MLRNLLNLPSWLQNAWAPTQMDHEDTVILFVVEGTEATHGRDRAAPVGHAPQQPTR